MLTVFVFEPSRAPLTPDSREAQELAETELAKAKYSDEPGLIQRFFNWVGDKLSDLLTISVDGEIDWGFVPALLLLVLIVGVALAVGVIARRRQIPLDTSGSRAPMFDDTRTSAELLTSAHAARGRGDLDTALVDSYRAAIRLLEDRRYIDVVPGMTALESATAGSAAVGEPELFHACATWFNRVYYSSFHASEEALADVDRLVALVGGLRARPASRTTAVVT